ncbi:MAG: diphosphate--fructose-6-phosphate 1-phosphotransferase, partial [Burkholderiales bacterium]
QGIAAMLRAALNVKVHWSVLDYVQRSARHLASATDVEQAYAAGKAAVEYALAGRSDVMPVIRRRSNKPYRWQIEPAPLAAIMNREKRLPRRFLSTDGWRLTAQGRAYFEPLIHGEAWPPFAGGLPVHARLKLQSVPPQLKSAFRSPD